MSFITKDLDPGVNPHGYVKDNYPTYKYQDRSIDKSFLVKKSLKFRHAILLKDYAGTYYLFAK